MARIEGTRSSRSVAAGVSVVALCLTGGMLLLGRAEAAAATALIEEATSPARCPVGLSRDGLNDIHPALKPFADGGRNLQAAEAVQGALMGNPKVSAAVAAGRPPESVLTGPTRARRMSAAEAERFIPTGMTGLISPERSVWVVTVHAPVAGRSLPPVPAGLAPGTSRMPRELPVFTTVTDACTGTLIVVGMGDPGLDR